MLARTPNAIFICILVSLGINNIGSVGILQLCGGQGNLGIAGSLHQLIGNSLGRTGNLKICNAAFNAANICAASCRVQEACGSINSTFNNNFSILQVRIGTGVGPSRCINYWSKGLIVEAVAEGSPLVSIIYIDIKAGTNSTSCTGSDFNLRTGKHGNILFDGNIARMDIDRNIAVNRQFVVLRINRRSTDRHIDRRKGQVTVGVHNKAVRCTIISLHNISGGQIEHSIAAGNKRNRGSKVRTGHINRGIGIFLSAGVQLQGNFNVLDIVLAQGEYAVFHIGTLGTAAEVRNLEHLIYGTTAVGGNTTGTGNEAIGIQCTAIVDGNVAAALHPDKADSTGRSAAIHLRSRRILLLGREADCTINNQVRTICHGQCAVGRRRSISTRVLHLSSIHRIGRIKGNQQGYAAGDGVVTSRQRAAVHQNNRFICRIALCLRCGSIQVIKQVAGTNYIVRNAAKTQQAGTDGFLCCSANCEPRCSAVFCKSSLHGHIRGRGQGIGSFRRENFTIRCVDPAQEGCSANGRCNQCGTGGAVDIHHSSRGYGLATDSNATIRTVKFKGNIRRCINRCQCNVANR